MSPFKLILHLEMLQMPNNGKNIDSIMAHRAAEAQKPLHDTTGAEGHGGYTTASP